MLKINNLTIKYGKRIIIDNQSISFNRGEITGIKGKSGVGKSSLLNVLGLIKTPNKECEYWYEGKKTDVTDEENNSLFRMNHIGFIFQQGNLLKNLSAKDNVILPQLMYETEEELIGQKADDWIKYVELENVKECYPEDLSGGEEQRIAIARALINDSDIILADEPTASLDEENSRKIMLLLKKMAHDMNKIVIVVSHDEETINCSDVIYEIKDRKLNQISRNLEKNNSENKTDVHKHSEIKKKTMSCFVKKYEKMRRREGRLNKILIAITAVIVTIASLSVGFGDGFTEKQKEFINSISDRSLLVINDTLGLNATVDYDDALSFEQETMEFIKNNPNVESVYPFYSFASYGMSADTSSNAKIMVYEDEENIYKEKEYINTYIADGNEFSVTPIFEEENVCNYLLEGSTDRLNDDEVYLTYTMAKDITDDPSELMGKYIKIHCYVPVKLYISEATKPESKTDAGNDAHNETTEIDGYVSKLVIIEKKIAGVLNNSYKNDKSDKNDKMILMNYSELSKIVYENEETLETRTFPEFEEKCLAPSMLVVYVKNYDDINNVENKISNYGSAISIVNRSRDIEETKQNLEGIKYTMITISIVLIVVVTIMFSLLYYFKNRERKREIGVLKALGLSQGNVLRLIGTDMVRNTVYTFFSSVIMAWIAQLVLAKGFGTEVVSVSVLSVILAFVISVVTVFMSGMVSVWKTSKIDIIDAIRLNK